jgi:hypothetical protein
MQDLIKKVEMLLIAKFPDEGQRADAVDKISKIVLLDTLDEALGKLKNNDLKQNFVDAMGSGRVEDAIKICNIEQIDLDEIFVEKSKAVVVEMFS